MAGLAGLKVWLPREGRNYGCTVMTRGRPGVDLGMIDEQTSTCA